MVRGPSEVVVDDNVVLGARSDEPNGTLRLRQEPTSGVDGRLVTVKCLHVMVGEPDPSSFKVSTGMACQVDSQEGSKALAISNGGRWALGQLELGPSSASKANV